MSLLNFLRDAFRPASRLRNKAGGMAWVRRYGEHYGAGAIEGQIVCTEWFDGEFWRVKPQPSYAVTKPVLGRNGVMYGIGAQLRVDGLPDAYLEPINDAGLTSKEVRELYLPGPKARQPA